MDHPLSKLLCWVMIFIVFTWSGFPQYQANAAQQQEPTKRLEKLFDALDEAAKEIPRETFDPEAIIKKVGTDPEALFVWVRDNTYLVPYQGSLRGPIGVLMDRFGNSLDRALLLIELLQIAGYEARLVQGALHEKQAQQLMQKVRMIPSERALPVENKTNESVDDLMGKFVAKYGFDKAEFKKIFNKTTLQQQHLAEEAAQRTVDQTASILAALKDAGIKTKAADETEQYKSLIEHWWVEWKQETDWVDLDPTLPDAQVGRIITEAVHRKRPEDLDKESFHLVTIRVIIERNEAGKLEEHAVLEQTLQPSSLFGKRIVLRHIPLNWPKDIDIYIEEDPFERLKEIVLKEKEWLPVLTVGDEQIAKYSFTNTGEVNEEPGKDPTADIGGGVGGMFGSFGGSLTGSSSGPEERLKKDSYLTAEWIEYEIQVPGKPTKVIRRQVFDLVGPAARQESSVPVREFKEDRRLERGYALLGEREHLLQVCHLSLEFVVYLITNGLLANSRILTKLLNQDLLSKESNKIAANLNPLPSQVYSLALSRFTWSEYQREIYLNYPNIICYLRGIRQHPGGEIITYQGFDIIENEIGIFPHSKGDPFRIRMEQGVLETNAEDLIMDIIGEKKWGAAEIFNLSEAHILKWRVLIDPDSTILKNIKIPKDALVRIKKDLINGNIVLVHEEAILIENEKFAGWWRINKESGNTIGMTQSGKGGDLVEYFLVSVPGLISVSIFGFPYYHECISKGKSKDRCLLEATIRGSWWTLKILLTALITGSIITTGGPLFWLGLFWFLGSHIASG